MPNEIPRATCHRGIVGDRINGKQHPGDKEPLIDLVPSYDREQTLPRAAHHEGHQEDRQIVERAVQHTGDKVVRAKPETHRRDHRALPVLKRRRSLRDGQVRLVAGVVGGHEDAAGQRQHHRHHQALQVESVSDMRGPVGDGTGGKENGVLGLPERIELLELATPLEVMGLTVEQIAEELHPSLSSVSSTSRNSGP